MTFTDQKEIFSQLRHYFGERVEKAIEKKIGDSSVLVAFGFGWKDGKPSVCYRYKTDGKEETGVYDLAIET